MIHNYRQESLVTVEQKTDAFDVSAAEELEIKILLMHSNSYGETLFIMHCNYC